MKTKAYIINIKFGIWENRLWFEAEDSPKMQTAWENAIRSLDGVAKQSVGSGDYFVKATEHFSNAGFDRIQV